MARETSSFLCSGANVSDCWDRCVLILMASFSKPHWWATGPRSPDGPDGILTSAEACGASQELTMGLRRLSQCCGERQREGGWHRNIRGTSVGMRCCWLVGNRHEKWIQIRFPSSCPCEPHGSSCPRCIYPATPSASLTSLDMISILH